MHTKELIDIVISVVTISLAFSLTFQLGSFPLVFLTVGMGFILHELAHKMVAIRFGCIAVYRMWIEGLILAVFMALAFRVVFAAPGAVYIYKPHLTRHEDGMISIAGPLTNIILAFIFLYCMLLPGLQMLGWFGFQVNIFLALFNLLPIPPLDGSKVFLWSKVAWLVFFALALAGVFAPDFFVRALIP
jgi:Zn-dependent protease